MAILKDEERIPKSSFRRLTWDSFNYHSSTWAPNSTTWFGALAGTFNAAAAGTATLNVQLFHLQKNHEDYEIETLAVTVT
ncbi:MAG: hypothetical protein WEE89_04315 [Gemmatimonadota bacterium]